MTGTKRFSSALAFSFFLFCSTQAQTPQVSTVNITAEESKVSISAAGDVLDMRVAVSDEAGDIVFESGPVAGDKLDWTMKDSQGQRVPAGTYTMTVTYRTSSGKLKRRVEQVLVTAEVTGGTSAAAEDPTPQAVGTITGQGTAGKVAKFTGANAIGNSVLTESAGRIGLGTAAPAQLLHVLGASSRLRLQSSGGASLTSTEYVTNNRLWQVGAGGSTAVGGVANKFFVLDQTANQYRLVIDTSGNFGIGTTAPTSKLTVNGMIQILGPTTNGIRFADGSIQTKAIAGTINGAGTANRLAKFTGPNSFGNSVVTEVSGKVGIGTTAPKARLEVIADANSIDGLLGWGYQHGKGVSGYSNASTGVYGYSGSNNLGHTVAGIYGENYSGGWAGYFNGPVQFTGNVGIGMGLANAQRLLHVNGRARIGSIPLEASTASVCFNGAGDLLQCDASSLRFKADVRPLRAGLDVVGRLRPISFNWKEGGQADVGLAAEEVFEVAPSLTFADGEGRVAGVRYERLNVLLINAVQEQQAQIMRLQELVTRQQAQLNQVRRAIKSRRARVRAR